MTLACRERMSTMPDPAPNIRFRRLILMPWRWRWWVWGCVVVTMTAAYPLSFAPMVKLQTSTRAGMLTPPIGSLHGWVIYKPADWLYDHTFLQAPLVEWEKICDVEIECRLIHRIRAGRLSGGTRASVIDHGPDQYPPADRLSLPR